MLKSINYMINKCFFLLSKYRLYITVLLNVIVFVFLLFKNPFSDRTLIPNFEPYPDAIHYVSSARSFVSGHGLQIYRNGAAKMPNVPPLYSFSLVPLFALYNDARMFYFTNIILAMLSFFLFYKILKKITNNILIIGLVLFLYVTNYFIYWYPTLAMAENLILPLFLMAVYLLMNPISKKNTLMASFLVVGFYSTKYAAAPLTAVFAALFFLKIILLKQPAKKKLIYAVLFVTFTSLFWISIMDIRKVLRSIAANLTTVLFQPLKGVTNSSKTTSTNFDNSPFSQYYFDKYFWQYWKAVLGSPARFLWDNTPVVPSFVGVTALIGFFVSLIKRNSRFLPICLFSMLFASIYFIASFYSFDMRFIYQVIPIMLLGFALFLSFIDTATKNYSSISKLFQVGVIALFIFYLLTNAIRFKKQIMLNLKYRETPWYYIAVVNLNKYFSKPADKKKPIVISALMPYYIDFFSNGNYDLLPLSESQDFFSKAKIAWGANDYSDLIALYKTRRVNISLQSVPSSDM